MTFASCANNSGTNSDNGNSNGTNNENPSPTLPGNMGENPITKTIKLKTFEDSDYYLELKTDGTARYIDEDDGKIESEYKYTYNEDEKTITVKLEKKALEDSKEIEFEEDSKGQLMTYSEICSEINKELTVEKVRESEKKSFEEIKNREKFKEEYPGCDTYEKYETAFLSKNGFESLAELVEYEKQGLINENKAIFGAQITYAYEIENDKMTLTEKFTGVKNLIDSECSSDGKSNYAYIDCLGASVDENDICYDGTVDTDKKTISFVSRADRKKIVEGTYTENISAGTVTIKFKDKEYLCEFEGDEYIQVE